MRLAKFLAAAGIASRRASEDIIRGGRVAVDGLVVTDPARSVGSDDRVTVDGQPISLPSERVVYMVNKPAGVLSTARDPHGRPTVVSLVPAGRRLYPVGRLDQDTTGLILLTDDGELAHRLTHPRFEVPKTYRARVAGGPIQPSALKALRGGVDLDDGPTAPAHVRLIAPDTLELTIREGRNRQIRRMCQAVGHRVRSLERVRFGPLELKALKPGAYRRLTDVEVAALGTRAIAGRAARSRSSAAPPAR
jgi:23S rRNA pseudouridine2605 synthase